MDPVTAIGVAAAIAQFVSLTAVVVDRISEYVGAGVDDVPRSLVNIHTQLPLLVSALQRAESEKQVSKYDQDTRLILRGVISGCTKLVNELDQISSKLLPEQGDNFAAKVKKALKSMKSDHRIVEIDNGLQSYIQILIFHHVVDRDEVPAAEPDEKKYFEVSETPVDKLESREEDIARIDECFRSVVRLQTRCPVYVTIQGDEGTGKSQLALAFAQQAYRNGQFQTVFWVSASAPSVLANGLKHVASIIRRTNSGSSDDKLDFLTNFLKERWRPWLLVLDDYDHSEFEKRPLSEFMPANCHGAILCVSRKRQGPGTIIRIHKYLNAEAKGWRRGALERAIRREDLPAIIAELDTGLSVDSVGQSVYGRDSESFINLAAGLGHDALVEEFFRRGASPHLIKSHSPVLGSAVRSGSLSTVKMCLDHQDRHGYKVEKHSQDLIFRNAIGNGRKELLLLLWREEANGWIPTTGLVAVSKSSIQTNTWKFFAFCIPKDWSPRNLASALMPSAPPSKRDKKTSSTSSSPKSKSILQK